MSKFNRINNSKWHNEIPGSRWFRADLHLHTLDDAVGGNVTWQAPPGIANSNDPLDDVTRKAYVHCFLKAAVSSGVEVLGLTPHSAHVPGKSSVSVVWDIVEAWQAENDDDGVPFREKIYAIFPGFEPSASSGKGGIHLIALFDPEIGKERYIKAFTIATGGQDVWRDDKHQTSTKDARELLSELKSLKLREGEGWDYLCIAPHAFSSKGVVESLKGDLGKYFDHGSFAALELKDNQLPQEAIDSHSYLENHLKEYCQPLIHCSDAYGLCNGGGDDEVPIVSSPQKRGIGYRYTLVKLASARIESLRQAFLSSDSRLRIVYEKDDAQKLQYRKDIPASIDLDKPWLRSITVEGGTSFFGGKDNKQTLFFSPDLTCIIGGRMTGKSTLLDGIRMKCEMPLPQLPNLAKDVQERSVQFLSGNPKITLDIASPVASTLSLRDRWPARFFTQRELANIAKEADDYRKILYHLTTDNKPLYSLDEVILEYDQNLNSLTKKIADLNISLSEKEQAFTSANKALQALNEFKEAGADALSLAQADQGRIGSFSSSIKEILDSLSSLSNLVADIKPPKLESISSEDEEIKKGIDIVAIKFSEAEEALNKLNLISIDMNKRVDAQAIELREKVQRILVEQGRKAEDLNEFDALSKIASGYEKARIDFDAIGKELKCIEEKFLDIEAKRLAAVSDHRNALRSVIEQVNENISTIKISLLEAASRQSLDEWIRGLKEPGITRWWNENTDVTDPSKLHEAFKKDELDSLGMSETVASRFKEQMTRLRIYQLRAFRSDDKCLIEAHVGPKEGDFKPIHKLSGGKQISVILSLLLEGSDKSPLVIDQPEDEIDKVFLAETLLPILRRLKGKRQIILATHDANLVVNGDADQVVHLGADAEHAYVEAQDAIDNLKIRQAILKVLDGGQYAFDLRNVSTVSRGFHLSSTNSLSLY